MQHLSTKFLQNSNKLKLKLVDNLTVLLYYHFVIC